MTVKELREWLTDFDDNLVVKFREPYDEGTDLNIEHIWDITPDKGDEENAEHYIVLVT